MTATRKRRSSVKHVVLGEDGRFVCKHCGESYLMALPVDLSVWLAAIEAFAKQHSRCTPRKDEPAA